MGDGHTQHSLRGTFGLGLCIALFSSVTTFILLLVFLVKPWFGVIVVSHDAGPSLNDAFNFAGVVITILAFVSAFYILLLAIDAFKISAMVYKNEDTINGNAQKIENVITPKLTEVEKRISAEEERLGKLDTDSTLASAIFAEMYHRSEDSRALFDVISGLSRACELGLDAKPDVARNYIKSVRDELSELTARDLGRQSRTLIQAQTFSNAVEADPMAIDTALEEVRTLAESGDAQAAEILAKFHSKRRT
ncbi:MAG: hypothetical protein AAFR02_04780 [Pseudomonadota bacterium]